MFNPDKNPEVTAVEKEPIKMVPPRVAAFMRKWTARFGFVTAAMLASFSALSQNIEVEDINPDIIESIEDWPKDKETFSFSKDVWEKFSFDGAITAYDETDSTFVVGVPSEGKKYIIFEHVPHSVFIEKFLELAASKKFFLLNMEYPVIENPDGSFGRADEPVYLANTFDTSEIFLEEDTKDLDGEPAKMAFFVSPEFAARYNEILSNYDPGDDIFFEKMIELVNEFYSVEG